MRNGFLYTLVNKLINILFYLNLVELFKLISLKLSPSDCEAVTKATFTRTSVDIFIIFKWTYVITLCSFNIHNSVNIVIVWYLLITNLYTYFYYHTWSSKILMDKHFDVNRIKRRFTNLILAISFSILGFAYLYLKPYSSDFKWTEIVPSFKHAIMFSLSNSLTASYDKVKPLTELGYSISMIQLIMMFTFLTIIISGSIPQINSEKQGE